MKHFTHIKKTAGSVVSVVIGGKSWLVSAF